MRKDLNWMKMLFCYSEELLKFTLNATCNTLPSPDNLRRWGFKADLTCGLCGNPNVTLNHILAGCAWVRCVENNMPREDRFTWRHNCLLLEIATALATYITEVNLLPLQKSEPFPRIRFVRAGDPKPATPNGPPSISGLLSRARDWLFDFDLPEYTSPSYAIPHCVAITAARPDGFIISHDIKHIILLELTSPLEENIKLWNQRKTDKYSDIQPEPGWMLDVVAFEVGAKG